MGLGVEVFLRFWRDLPIDVPCYSIRWSELVLLYVNWFLLFDLTRLELVEGQQSYKG